MSLNRVLVIPDVHQDINFLHAIDERVNFNTFNRVIFLGDYFDTYIKSDSPRYFSVNQTCQYFIELKDRLKHKLVMLIGNHDLAYFEFSIRAGTKWDYNGPLYLGCSGYTNSKAADIHKAWNVYQKQSGRDNFWANLKFYHIEDGILYSHAGVTHELYSNNYNITDLSTLKQHLLSQIDNPFAAVFERHSLVEMIGFARGGHHKHGGIVWNDSGSFTNNPEIVQVFGHSTYPKRVQMFDDSLNIDGSQQIFMTIENGKKFIHSISDNTDDEVRVEINKNNVYIEDQVFSTNEPIEL